MTVPEPLHPKRSAHASIRGYLYQTCLGVLRWLELKPGEVLVCEGNEDLDRLFNGSNVYEQAKAYTEPIGFTSPVVMESLSNFARDYVTLCKKGQQPRFVFTTTAPRKTPRSGPDLLEAWADQARRAEVAAAVRDRLASSDLEGLAEAREWFDAEVGRWEAFVGAVQWSFGESFEGVHGEIQRRLAALKETRRLPAEIFADRLAVAVMEASSRKDVQGRALTPEDLAALARTSREELEGWAESAEAQRFRSTFEEAKHLDSLLFDNTRDLPPNAGPGKLLSAAYEVIPFDDAGRREELEMLEDWCSAEDRMSVRLLTGEGGSGKTRLMIEWCKRLREQGWHAGFFRPDRGAGDLDSLFKGVLPRLVVLDYAETKLRIVAPLLLKMALAPKDSGLKLRLLLLARRSGDWWPGLTHQGEAVEDFLLRSPEPRTISPLVSDPEDRPQVFEDSRRAFTAHLRSSPPGRGQVVSGEEGQVVGFHPDLSGKDYQRVLYIHMAALLAALNDKASGAKDALKRILDHERTFWSNQALELRLDSSLTDLVRDAMEPVMTGLTLVGGVGDQAQAYALLGCLLRSFPLRADLPNAMLRLLRRLYGGSANQGGRYLDPLEPDLLGEQLVDEHLEKHTDLLARLLDGAHREEQYSTLTVLTRIARDRKDSRWLQMALKGNLEALAEIALDVAVTAGDPIGVELSKLVEENGTLPLVATLVTRCDDKENRFLVPLREIAASATARLLTLRREQLRAPTEEQQAELAGLANNLGNRLSKLGRHEDSLQATQEAVSIWRQLTQQRPDVFQPDLAMSLNNLGNILSDLGREDALHAAQEAVDSYRTLAQQRPDAFLPGLAMSLTSLGKVLSNLGRREDALHTTQEAVSIRRQLALQPDAFLPDLAMSLYNLGTMLRELGRHQDALHATQEAADFYRTLAQQRPAAFLPDLALSLNSLGVIFSDLGRCEDALHTAQEAVDAYRTLTQQRPDAFLPYLAGTLNTLGLCLSALGRREDALHAMQDAVDYCRALAQQRPGTFLSDLARSLNSLGIGLRELGRLEDALYATQEAISIRRQLAQQRPDAFLPNLARSLYNLSKVLGDLEKQENAFSAVEEAIHILTPFFLRYPEALEPLMRAMAGQYLTCTQATNREPDPELLRPIQEFLEESPKPEA